MAAEAGQNAERLSSECSLKGYNDAISGGGWFPGTGERVRTPERVELEGVRCADGDRDPPEMGEA